MTDALDRDRLAAFESFAIGLARAAGEVILPLFRRENGLEDKGAAKDGAFDPVTAADRGAEAAIRRAIAAAYPDHGVIGEEYGEDRPDADFVWVLDPIDGTRGFIAGMPLWTTLIALRFQGRPVVGLIGQPYLDEVFVGTAQGSRLLHRGHTTPLAVRPCPRLDQAVIVTTDPLMFKGADAAAWMRLKGAARLARYSADAYAYALAAAGQLDLVIETGLKAWDIEAAIPLLQGAGGSVTDWQGRPLGSKGGACLIAGDPACRDQAIAMLEG
jgi:histidinol phosphatase-like enzyme (inositol monophosphatase family)